MTLEIRQYEQQNKHKSIANHLFIYYVIKYLQYFNYESMKT